MLEMELVIGGVDQRQIPLRQGHFHLHMCQFKHLNCQAVKLSGNDNSFEGNCASRRFSSTMRRHYAHSVLSSAPSYAS